MKNLFFTVLALGIALSLSAQRMYINPGHGDWGPNSRPMATVSYPNLHATTGGPDTLGFYESNTNLWKAFALNEKLQSAGYTTMMSRTENGPYPYVSGDESIDKPLADICAEVNWFEADYFISIHSNANVDGDNVNFPLIIHSGYDEVGFQDERNMALATWPRLFEAFGNDEDYANITHGFEPNSAYALNEDNVRGSISFYGYNLSTLLHNYQGYLVEGYFHTYQPARHRALNPEWCRQEGIRYFRGIQDYYKKPGENVGYIMGCVRSLTEMSNHLFNSMSTSYDKFLPINGAKVVLRDASGNIIPTECYRHVALHSTDEYYYTTDNNYNGIFVFENLQPGTYTLTVHAAGYQDKKMEVPVTANATVYPEIFLEQGQGTEPQINVDVKWVLNGGTVDGTLPSTITEEYNLPTPSKAGYIFVGWYDNAEGTGTAITTLSVGYEGTVYALWESTSVTWQLNGGHVSENKLLWEDFQKTILKNNPLVPIENASTVINEVGGQVIYNHLSDAEGGYKWLGDYLWNKASPHTDPGSGNEYIWWGNMLNAFLNSTTYNFYCHHCSANVTVDFTEAGKYDSWKGLATEEIRQKVTLPNQITSDYTIPTPEKEGYNFLGWYDTNNTTGNQLINLSEGYNGTIYAIWDKAPVTTVTWELNGGHVYPSNDWLWQDFITTFNSVSATDFATRPTTYEEFSSVWGTSQTNCYMLTPGVGYDNEDYKRYHWFGDYLWAKAWTASASTNEQSNMSSGNEWWGKLLWACLTCTACEYTASSGKTIFVDFSVAGQPKSWRTFAIENQNTKNIAQDFYNEIILPRTIATDYTIPTPEREGYTFQGWYNNPKGEGDPIIELKAHSAGTIYAIWQEPVPCIVAYDLNCKYLTGKMAFEFSFYANTQPTAGKLKFYNMNEEPIGEYTINYLWQGKNTVVINAGDIPALNQELIEGRDFLWEVHLEARPSTLFAEIFRSQPFNTAYATIDNSPESDFFGSIWVANQLTHGYNTITDGEIWRLVPEQGYAREGRNDAQQGHRPHRPQPNPNGGGWRPPHGGGGQQPPQDGGGQPQGGPQSSQGDQPQGGGQQPPRGSQPNHAPAENEGGFEVIFRPTVAPDGTLYLTDNGKSYGGVFVMDPHTKQITNFFEGCTYENGEWKDNGNVVGSGSTGAHIYWTEDGNNKNGFHPTTSKLFLMHNAHAADDPQGITKGFFVYDLMDNTQQPTLTDLMHKPNQSDPMIDYDNTDVTDYAIVGTSRGAWVCQLRNEDKNVISDPSLTFYPSDNSTPTIFTKSLDTSVGGIFGDNELIHGSWGSAIAVNKEENLLAMVGGTGNIMLFDITWEGSVPTLSNKRDYPVVADDQATTGIYDIPVITTLNFDYAGNLVATLGETYNDASDKHQVAIFTLPKTPNEIKVPSRFSQRVPSLVEDDQCASIAEVNKPYETVEIHRKMQAGMYNTICLPFGIKTLEGTLYQGASVMEFVGTTIDEVGGEDMLKLNFRELTFQDGDVMQAGVPYLIQPQQDIKEPVRVSGVSTSYNIGGMSITPNDSKATFHGITGPTQIEKNPNILFLVADNRLATATVSGPMLGNRAYFELDNTQNLPKRSMISIVKSTPAGFEEIYNTYQTEAYKMLYNGMIVIVRDGVMYDLMGTRIK